jgi:hypothetical protein
MYYEAGAIARDMCARYRAARGTTSSRTRVKNEARHQVVSGQKRWDRGAGDVGEREGERMGVSGGDMDKLWGGAYLAGSTARETS